MGSITLGQANNNNVEEDTTNNNNYKKKSSSHTQKLFTLINYILIGASSSCVFLTLSLRLIPSVWGFLLILLHLLTIAGALAGCAACSSGRNRWYAAHMGATILTAIFQGSVGVLMLTRTGEVLGALKTYVREENGEGILKMVGGLGLVVFGLDWVVLTLAFFLNYYYRYDHSTNNQQQQQDLKDDWPWPFQL